MVYKPFTVLRQGGQTTGTKMAFDLRYDAVNGKPIMSARPVLLVPCECVEENCTTWNKDSAPGEDPKRESRFHLFKEERGQRENPTGQGHRGEGVPIMRSERSCWATKAVESRPTKVSLPRFRRSNDPAKSLSFKEKGGLSQG